MKTPLQLAALCVTLILLPFNGSAAIVSADRLSAGDKLITRDTSTGLKWLNLTVTLGQSHDEVANTTQTGQLLEG